MQLAYEVEALATGWRLGLHTSDMRNLVALALRYGWKPTAGVDRYLHEGKQVVSSSEARALAAALRRTLGDLPPERRKELRPVGTAGSFVAEAMRLGAPLDRRGNHQVVRAGCRGVPTDVSAQHLQVSDRGCANFGEHPFYEVG